MLSNPDTWPPAADHAAFILSFGAFLVPLLVVASLKLARRLTPWRTRGLLAASTFLLLVLNPVAQLFTLGPMDAARRNSWTELAETQHLVGKTPNEVRNLFGEPCDQREEAPRICRSSDCVAAGTPYTAWDYAPVPFFWFSHAGHFKVFFRDGLATGFNHGG